MEENKTTILKPPFTNKRNPPPASSSHASSPVDTREPNGNIQTRSTQSSLSTVSRDVLNSLPTISGRGTKVFLVDDDIGKFLEWDLDLSRLNRIHNHLWMAGRPLRAKPLHRYKMMGNQILPTQQADLHLLLFSHRVLLKPLAEYMLSFEFWETHLCEKKDLHKSACGLLLSYIWLLCSPIDLTIAHEHHLVPKFVTWHWWKDFVKDFCNHVDVNALDQVNKRYQFGELRLSRINTIYRTRFMFTHFVRGYLYGYNRYVVFFERNFNWMLIVFVFLSLVLSAMQVGAGIPPLQGNVHFNRASYGFVVFSMVSVAAVLSFVGVVYFITFFFNMGAAIQHDQQERRERRRLALERDESKSG